MFFIPGIAITLLTFPGVIVHELAHQLFCRWYKVPVFKVVYFQAKNPAGYVLHEVPQRKWQTIMISIGPFFINTIVAALIAMPAALPVFRFNSGNIGDYLLIYLSISIGMHAFPSTGDAQSIINVMKDTTTPMWLKNYWLAGSGINLSWFTGQLFLARPYLRHRYSCRHSEFDIVVDAIECYINTRHLSQTIYYDKLLIVNRSKVF